MDDSATNEVRAERVLALLLKEQPDPTECGESFAHVVQWSDELSQTIRENLDADSIWDFVNLVYEHIDKIRRTENAVKGGNEAAKNRQPNVTDKQLEDAYRRYLQVGMKPRNIAAAIAKVLPITDTRVRQRLKKMGLREKR